MLKDATQIFSQLKRLKIMKVGELERYSLFPHLELHESGMVGIIISVRRIDYPSATAMILWNCDRPQGSRYEPQLDYLDDLEVLNETK